MVAGFDASRRETLTLLLAAASAAWGPKARAQDPSSGNVPRLRTRPIPQSGESLPVVGLGTAIVFDVGATEAQRAGPQSVVHALIAQGGTLIDTAPSYGQAESVLGDILTKSGQRKRVFLSTKLEHDSFANEPAGLQASLRRLQTDRVDLLQLHNVRDPRQTLTALRALKSRGLCRYTGITTTFGGAYDAAEAIVKRERPDFLEIDYAIDNRDAETRVLPAARDAGTAVLVALPFGRGRLFRLALGKPLPEWVAQFDCHSWAQFFLKWVLSHPAVTAAIPGTDKATHMIDNLGAALGRLPDAPMRDRMLQYVQSLS
ncbi:MAG TPA: aldo/keto reductase [Steroidobacteraceae bacterium]|jgi:aryl-alcohol dehydrogenase-like predicted oxidoreductase|nr:aldo/keto reductase [Steroidobacteraceae bacterium]